MVDRWASSLPAKKITRAKGEGIVVGRQAEATRETMFLVNGSLKKHASSGGCPDLGFIELGKLTGSTSHYSTLDSGRRSILIFEILTRRQIVLLKQDSQAGGAFRYSKFRPGGNLRYPNFGNSWICG
jgi:hypothetical protein